MDDYFNDSMFNSQHTRAKNANLHKFTRKKKYETLADYKDQKSQRDSAAKERIIEAINIREKN